jgi:hypothetical protein
VTSVNLSRHGIVQIIYTNDLAVDGIILIKKNNKDMQEEWMLEGAMYRRCLVYNTAVRDSLGHSPFLYPPLGGGLFSFPFQTGLYNTSSILVFSVNEKAHTIKNLEPKKYSVFTNYFLF